METAAPPSNTILRVMRVLHPPPYAAQIHIGFGGTPDAHHVAHSETGRWRTKHNARWCSGPCWQPTVSLTFVRPIETAGASTDSIDGTACRLGPPAIGRRRPPLFDRAPSRLAGRLGGL